MAARIYHQKRSYGDEPNEIIANNRGAWHQCVLYDLFIIYSETILNEHSERIYLFLQFIYTVKIVNYYPYTRMLRFLHHIYKISKVGNWMVRIIHDIYKVKNWMVTFLHHIYKVSKVKNWMVRIVHDIYKVSKVKNWMVRFLHHIYKVK